MHHEVGVHLWINVLLVVGVDEVGQVLLAERLGSLLFVQMRINVDILLQGELRRIQAHDYSLRICLLDRELARLAWQIRVLDGIGVVASVVVSRDKASGIEPLLV